MKAIIEINFTVDGKKPDRDTLVEAVWRLVSTAGYIGSEAVDGTDQWRLEVGETTLRIENEQKQWTTKN